MLLEKLSVHNLMMRVKGGRWFLYKSDKELKLRKIGEATVDHEVFGSEPITTFLKLFEFFSAAVHVYLVHLQHTSFEAGANYWPGGGKVNGNGVSVNVSFATLQLVPLMVQP